MKNFPLVSVIVASYNHADFIVKALDSVATQTYPNLELIIVDDCSKDSSVSKIKAWAAKRGSNTKSTKTYAKEL